MAIEAPLSKFNKQNLMIIIVVLLAVGAWFTYDGYFNEKFIQEHTDKETNKPDSTLIFNKQAPPYMLGGAIIVGAWLMVVKGRKVTADDSQIVIDDKVEIKYDAIQSVNKTFFEDKGFFTFEYKDGSGNTKSKKLSRYTYDNIESIMDKIVEKIS